MNQKKNSTILVLDSPLFELEIHFFEFKKKERKHTKIFFLKRNSVLVKQKRNYCTKAKERGF